MENTGTVTLTNSTVSRNASGRVAGGLFNTGTVTLVQSLLSGNTAPVIRSGGVQRLGPSGQGTVTPMASTSSDMTALAGVAGFTLGATDLVPAAPLSAILDPTLELQRRSYPHPWPGLRQPRRRCRSGRPPAPPAPISGARPGPRMPTGIRFADCDSGAVERGLIPVQAALTNTTARLQ